MPTPRRPAGFAQLARARARPSSSTLGVEKAGGQVLGGARRLPGHAALLAVRVPGMGSTSLCRPGGRPPLLLAAPCPLTLCRLSLCP